MPTPPSARLTIHYGFALLAAFALIGTLGPAVMFLMSDDPSTSVDDYETTWGWVWLVWGGMWTVIWAAFAVQHTLRNRR